MNARSALFDLYGDHLRHRGGSAPVAALVRLLGVLDVAAPAVRTAVSRMVRQGWLEPVRLAAGPGYALTRKASARLDEAAVRIYRTREQAWDRRWHLLVLTQPAERSSRDRIRAGLAFLGYAPLSDTTWVGPRESEEVDDLLAADGVHAHRFAATLEGDPAGLAASTWDLAGLARAYGRWHAEAERLVAEAGDRPSDALAFAVRSRLVHEWRKFLFTDPGLPRELLPEPWPGEDAARLFDAESRRLLPGAQRFVSACLGERGGTAALTGARQHDGTNDGTGDPT